MNNHKKAKEIEMATHTCAWCGKRIADDSEVFAIDAKIKKGACLKKYEGGIMYLPLSNINKTIMAIVTTDDSQAKKEGKDLLFTVCSIDCGQLLKIALQDQLELIELTKN